MSHRFNARRSPLRRFFDGVRRFLSDARDAWADPTIPAATPTLSRYPLDRH